MPSKARRDCEWRSRKKNFHQVETLVSQNAHPWVRKWAAAQLWPTVALGNMGPAWPELPNFQEKLDILNELSHR